MPPRRKPNRAPGFTSLYADEDHFNDQLDDAGPPPTYARGGAAPRARSASLEHVATARGLPAGFSPRNLGQPLAQQVGGRIVSEHDGLIDTLLVCVPRHSRGVDPMDARHYAALFAGLGAEVNYLVVCGPGQQNAVRHLAAGAGVPNERLDFVLSPRFDYSIWAQDAYVAINDAQGRMILCEGISFPRYEDMTVADDVAAQSEVSVLQSYLYFQGGNVLNAGGLTMIGMDYVHRNTRRFRLPDRDSVLQEFSRLFGTDVLPLGGRASGQYAWYADGRLSGYGQQPIFHIDMYVTPTGVTGRSGREIVFLGRPEAARRAVGRWSDVPELDNGRYDAFFDETEEALQQHFEVRHLPLWLTAGTLGYDERRHYNLTFNNCLVQNAGEVRRVLLPSYAQDAATYGVDADVRHRLEDAAAAEWRRLGFEVSWMDGLEDLVYSAGAVHCITKTLRRRPAGPRIAP